MTQLHFYCLLVRPVANIFGKIKATEYMAKGSLCIGYVESDTRAGCLWRHRAAECIFKPAAPAAHVPRGLRESQVKVR